LSYFSPETCDAVFHDMPMASFFRFDFFDAIFLYETHRFFIKLGIRI